LKIAEIVIVVHYMVFISFNDDVCYIGLEQIASQFHRGDCRRPALSGLKYMYTARY